MESAAVTAAAAASSSIAAVAARIHERSIQLANDRQKLNRTLEQLQQTKYKIESEKRVNNSARLRMLQKTKMRDESEIELLQHQDEISKINQDIENIKYETENTARQTKTLEEDWEKVVKEIYAPHLVATDIHQRTWKCDKDFRENKRRKRDEKLNGLVVQSELAQRDAASVDVEREQILDEIRVMEDREEREDEKIAALAFQIKATLSKRTSLRGALKDSRARNREANDSLVQWEEECMKLTMNVST
eukprot:CAMPEP_0194371184 /NCGR_PEP_ID=MMETSP0174-20130528/19570_1 /TAXON_ID=216777 /ORGANISM="Proboscia alata, Strain PI-D3" /LENGTH=247 /DNA_ID=CAMNT_0039149091 /DNA_START=106 /DNA_END=849 /DNA_ORIENTATION=+